MKRISKKEASEKYGVITTGINSMYRYYLNDAGEVVDSDGDVRYTPPKEKEITYKQLMKNTKAYRESKNEL